MQDNRKKGKSNDRQTVSLSMGVQSKNEQNELGVKEKGKKKTTKRDHHQRIGGGREGKERRPGLILESRPRKKRGRQDKKRTTIRGEISSGNSGNKTIRGSRKDRNRRPVIRQGRSLPRSLFFNEEQWATELVGKGRGTP